MVEKNFLTTKDAAKRMGVSVSTVRRYIHRGEFQAKRVKGTYYITIDEFERFMFNRWWQGKQAKWF
jgi:excisionase family DNA binding protein